MPLLHISGHILNKWYQEAKLIADDIVAADETNLAVECNSMLEYQWLSYLGTQKRLLGGKALEHDPAQPLVVHSSLGYLGGLEELIVWATQSNPDYADPRSHPEYGAVEEELQTLADREFAAHIEAATLAGGAFAYLDFGSRALDAVAAGKAQAGGAPSRPGTSAGGPSRPMTQGGSGRRRSTDGSLAGGEYGPHRVIVELFQRRCPQTVANFLALCTGSAGSAKNPATGASFPLHYTGSVVHRIVPDGWIQMGDIVSGRGCDGHSALGAPTFPDEHLHTPIDAAGLLCMANQGPHTNASQFFFSLAPLPAFSHKHVVFGRVIFGAELLVQMGGLPCRHNQRPMEPLKIVQSDVFTANMLDDHVNKWTRKRGPLKKKKQVLPSSAAASAASDSPQLSVKNATLLVLGFGQSGKSTLVNNLLGRPFEPTNPTIGFERKQLTLPAAPASQADANHSPFQLQLYGLGGAPNIRGYWYNYLDAAYGVVFVVDASATDGAEGEWEELAREFRALVSHPLIQGKPVLIYANKQDVPGSLSAAEVSMRLHTDALAAVSPHIHVVKCCARTDIANRKPVPVASPLSPAGAALHPEVDPAAATGGVNPGTLADVDPSIPRGIGWILARIEADYPALSERVATEIAEARRRAKEQMDASRAKILAARLAREAAEEEEEKAKAAAQ